MGIMPIITYQSRLEICEFLEKCGQHLSYEVIERLASYREAFGQSPFANRLELALTGQLLKNKDRDLNNLNTDEYIQTYCTYAEHDLFARNPEIQQEYDEVLSEQLDLVKNPEDAIGLCEKILFNVRIDNPVLRKKINRKMGGV